MEIRPRLFPEKSIACGAKNEEREDVMNLVRAALAAFLILAAVSPAKAQRLPSAVEIAAYTGFHAAAAKGDAETIRALLAKGEKVDARDAHGRTPLMVAAHFGRQEAAKALIAAGADLAALDADRYDAVTIASVANDPEMLRILLAAGASAALVTSPYDGTALIASAHLGHAEVVRLLIAARAPLDHVNNLGWTALIESIVLGDGGPAHVACLKALVGAGARVDIRDSNGVSPLGLARARGYSEMAAILEAAGAKP
jgi:ankyrin repeat protein